MTQEQKAEQAWINKFNDDTAIKILEKWGNEKQIDMIVEECAEVIQAMQKYKRYNDKQQVRDNCNEEI